MLKDKKILIFDLGGVLIDLHVDRSFEALLEMGVDAHLLTERNCLMSSVMMKYDRGDINTDMMFGYIASQLPDAVREGWGDALDDRLYEIWNMMLGSYSPSKFRRLAQLRAEGYRVVMLSNTNDAHWEPIEEKFLAEIGEPLSNFFDAFYLSYRMHLRKPEKEIFLELLASECADASECIFFDDSEENCAVAREVGIDAVKIERNEPWGDSGMI